VLFINFGARLNVCASIPPESKAENVSGQAPDDPNQQTEKQ